MPWYTHTHAESLPESSRSLTVAFSNLLQKLNFEEAAPNDLHERFIKDDPNIDWWTIGDYVKGLEVGDIEDGSGWPKSVPAIIRFRRMDPLVGGFTDHYCLLIDLGTKSIVDSLDGMIKASTTYGEPTGYATYSRTNTPTLPTSNIPAEIVEPEHDPKGYYTVSAADANLWGAARVLNVSVDSLIEENKLKDPRVIKPGMRIRVPKRKYVEKYPIRYEILPRPAQMHVSRPEGARKVRFGRATKWVDIEDTGSAYGFQKNLWIVAIAHVTLKDENTTAAYYMDAVSLGDYLTTGMVRYTIGFNHSHLTPGHLDPLARPPLTAQIVETLAVIEKKKVEATVNALEPILPIETVEAAIEAIQEPEPPVEPPVTYKDTIEPIANGEPVTYTASETVLVHEIEGRSEPKLLKKGQEVELAYTLIKDNVLYGLPVGYESYKYWYVVPMDKVEDLYQTDIPLAQRAAIGMRLTPQEQLWVRIAKFGSNGTRLKHWFEKQIK